MIALADAGCGFATIAHLPGAEQDFAKIESKSKLLGTARGGIDAVARAAHPVRDTVWDAAVTAAGGGKTLALYRCPPMILWPKGS